VDGSFPQLSRNDDPGACRHEWRKPLDLEEVRDTRPIPLDQLAGHAELVVVGRLVRLKSYLSDNKKDVYTDYELVPKQVTTDRARRQTTAAPGLTPRLVVTPMVENWF
jgi:hypothetical protein